MSDSDDRPFHDDDGPAADGAPTDDGAPRDGQAPAGGARQLVLVKKGQRYLFRYEQGQEARMLAHLVELVQQPDADLDWFDAAVLSHQMGRRLSHQFEHFFKSSRVAGQSSQP